MDVNDAVEGLLRQPTHEEQQVIDVVWAAFQRHSRWPVHDYVARAAEANDIDLDAVMAAAPTWSQPAYGWFVVPTSGSATVPGAQVSLTVAGLAHAAGAPTVVDGYLRVVRELAALWQHVPNDPHAPAELTIRYADVVGYLSPPAGGVEKRLVDAVESLLVTEPATWGGNRAGVQGDWTWSVPRSVTRFAQVTDAASYLRTVAGALHVEVHRRPAVASAAVNGPSLRVAALHPALLTTATPLFNNAHYAAAVFEAFKAVEVRVRELSGVDESGRKLMQQAFGGKEPAIDISIEAGRAGEDEQEGFMLIFMGVMQGIRNPKAHLVVHQEDQQRALEYLAVASILLRRLDDAAAKTSLDA